MSRRNQGTQCETNKITCDKSKTNDQATNGQTDLLTLRCTPGHHHVSLLVEVTVRAAAHRVEQELLELLNGNVKPVAVHQQFLEVQSNLDGVGLWDADHGEESGEDVARKNMVVTAGPKADFHKVIFV